MPITIAMSSELLFKEKKSPGPGFHFVKALNTVNDTIKTNYPESTERFNLILIKAKSSHGHDDSHGFSDLVTKFLENGGDLVAKLKENKTHLYLSAESGSLIQEAVNEGIAAAFMDPKQTPQVSELEKCQLRFVFDGDAVLFSDDSERVNKTGLQNFFKHEEEKVDEPMNEGPFKNFLVALANMQKKLSDRGGPLPSVICTYLVTSRHAGSPGYRVFNTLKTWGVELDQAYFLNGSPKGPMLKMISPHIFFDDQEKHVENAVKENILSCHVPFCKENA